MNDLRSNEEQLAEVRKGLRMSQPPNPERLAAERELLREAEAGGLLTRLRAYSKLLGPGYLQSAMTLGGGTAASSLFAGAAFGYSLLWVAPVAMALGVVMLAAVAHQTLSTGMRPFDAMRRFAGAPLAYGWAIGALLSSVIWHFPQYSLASAVLTDMGEVVGLSGISKMAASLFVLAWAIFLSQMYGRSTRWVRLYERALKFMVWGIVLCFGLVVAKTGIHDVGALVRGFVAFEIPGERNGIVGVTVVLSGLTAAVGVNMLFLYPYSLLARGWSREHRPVARADLLLGMWLPYTLATTLMVIATANTMFFEGEFSGSRLAPVEAARSLAAVVGPSFGRVIFNVGILGMALSSITLHMLTAGFVCAELFGWEVGSRKYFLATLLPTPGVLGPLFWGEISVYLAVPTNILCGFLLPLAYLGFTRLQRSRDYLRDDMPRGPIANTWWSLMIFTTLFLTVFLGWFAVTKLPGYFDDLFAS